VSYFHPPPPPLPPLCLLAVILHWLTGGEHGGWKPPHKTAASALCDTTDAKFAAAHKERCHSDYAATAKVWSIVYEAGFENYSRLNELPQIAVAMQ
jgi:hypothetical protein